jgi:hypothetical protein
MARLRSEAAIGLATGRVLDRAKVAKHFALTIGEGVFDYRGRHGLIAAEAALDGLYVIRTSVPPEELPAAAVVGAYKSLTHAERAFRNSRRSSSRCPLAGLTRAASVKADRLFICETPHYDPDDPVDGVALTASRRLR